MFLQSGTHFRIINEASVRLNSIFHPKLNHNEQTRVVMIDERHCESFGKCSFILNIQEIIVALIVMD